MTSVRAPAEGVYGQGKAAELRRAVHQLLLEHKTNGELPTSNRSSSTSYATRHQRPGWGFLHTNVAPWLVGNERRVLYVGDLDLAGHDIEGNTRSVLERAAGRVFGDRWTRVALTADQVRGNRLPVVEKTDRRFRPPRLHASVEVESLGQGVVTVIVRDALDELLPEPLDRVGARERLEREQARARLSDHHGFS